MMQRDIRLAANACPKCFKKLDAATCVEKDRLPGWRPEPGDLSVCLYCGAFLMYDKAMRLQILPGSEVVKLPREKVELMMNARRLIYARRKS